MVATMGAMAPARESRLAEDLRLWVVVLVPEEALGNHWQVWQ